MNEAYYTTCVGLFLAAAPLLLGIRLAVPKRIPWWAPFLLAAFLGWVTSNLAVHFYYRRLGELLTAAGGIDAAPQELAHKWATDGGKSAFAYLCGWLYGLVYLVPWLVLYSIVLWRLKARSKNTRSVA